AHHSVGDTEEAGQAAGGAHLGSRRHAGIHLPTRSGHHEGAGRHRGGAPGRGPRRACDRTSGLRGSVMAGFSEEQLELLHAAFEHLWQRSADLHEDLNEDSTRLAVVAGLLVEKGVITYPEFQGAVAAITAEANAAVAVDWRCANATSWGN